MQPHLPSILADESLYNLLARFSRINGYDSDLNATRRFLGQSKASSIVGCGLESGRAGSRDIDAYGSRQWITQHFTVHSLMRHLGGRLNHHENAPINSDSAKTYHAKQKRSGLLDIICGEQVFWRICPACEKFDRMHHGVAYWHRVHQLPTSLVCPQHGMPLSSKSLPKRQLHDRLWFPHEIADRALSPSLDKAHWLEIAMIGRDGLLDHAKPYAPEVIQAVFKDALIQRRLMTRQSQLIPAAFLSEFDAFFGNDFKQVMEDELAISDPRLLLRGLVDSRQINPLWRLILVYWLFGSWQRFKQYCEWQTIFGMPNEAMAKVETTSSLLTEIRNAHRQQCLVYLRSHQHGGRRDFLKREYKTFKWLLHHDLEWLNRHLPIERAFKQLELF